MALEINSFVTEIAFQSGCTLIFKFIFKVKILTFLDHSLIFKLIRWILSTILDSVVSVDDIDQGYIRVIGSFYTFAHTKDTLFLFPSGCNWVYIVF